ncbi:MAG: biotin--[acetyl-CoA-carboxylase] ligase [Erysipelotrichaceae bacterium]|nr:biotin--[acetyl-CoA-carboxylase] ligase [Solobacterium sp.]MDY3795050.1 biotin--[acetyl-CoA-carboxylase] ligase [Erysipelotrichaceae bacterium]
MKTIHFETIDSTNTYLKENYEKLDNFTFVSADFQSAGRGRNNRNWKSEKGENLLFSLLIKDKALIDKFSSLSVISAFSIIKALNLEHLSIKWPNDIYYKDSKLCGILLEAVTINEIECLIIGIGLNVNQREFVGEYKRTPTSLYQITNQSQDMRLLKDKIFNQIYYDFTKVKEGYDFYNDIKEYDYLKDRKVYAEINNEVQQIKVIGIDSDYSLKVLKDNKIYNLSSGEITFHL